MEPLTARPERVRRFRWSTKTASREEWKEHKIQLFVIRIPHLLQQGHHVGKGHQDFSVQIYYPLCLSAITHDP